MRSTSCQGRDGGKPMASVDTAVSKDDSLSMEAGKNEVNKIYITGGRTVDFLRLTVTAINVCGLSPDCSGDKLLDGNPQMKSSGNRADISQDNAWLDMDGRLI